MSYFHQQFSTDIDNRRRSRYYNYNIFNRNNNIELQIATVTAKHMVNTKYNGRIIILSNSTRIPCNNVDSIISKMIQGKESQITKLSINDQPRNIYRYQQLKSNIIIVDIKSFLRFIKKDQEGFMTTAIKPNTFDFIIFVHDSYAVHHAKLYKDLFNHWDIYHESETNVISINLLYGFNDRMKDHDLLKGEWLFNQINSKHKFLRYYPRNNINSN